MQRPKPHKRILRQHHHTAQNQRLPNCSGRTNYSEAVFVEESFSPEELTSAADYVAELRRGNQTLEAMDSYETTRDRHIALSALKTPICFIPLQLEDDMAVTMFIKGSQNYRDFVSSLPQLIDDNPEVTFVVKPHPLSKIDVLSPKQNVIFAERRDNIHYLIDVASVTLCYNSGVGLLSILHEKPTVTLGNAFYNIAGLGYRASSANEGLSAFRGGKVLPPRADEMVRLAAWFLHRKYSSFTAVDDVKEFASRKAHSYKDILVTRLRLDGVTYKLDRLKRHTPFSWSSHVAASISAQPKRNDHNRDQPVARLIAWGKKDFEAGDFAQAAELFERAFSANKERPNLLRYAAEAYWRSGERRLARAVQAKAVKLLPGNTRAKLRLLTMTVPPLGVLIGSHEMKISG